LLVAVARYSEARALVSLGQPKKAAVALDEARQIFLETLNGAGILLRHQGDLAAARRSYEASLAIARRIDDKADEVVEFHNIALVRRTKETSKGRGACMSNRYRLLVCSVTRGALLWN
jgi:hypothetical protein